MTLQDPGPEGAAPEPAALEQAAPEPAAPASAATDSPGPGPAPTTEPGHTGAMLAQEEAEMAGVMGTPLTRALRLGTLVALLAALGIWKGLPIVIVILAIVAIIFLHELGHYLAAKWSGMKVTEFFIGFGPRIWSFRRGETEYGIKAIPAGAYVKIPGMTAMEEVDPADEPRTYRQAPFHNRLAVAVAGSTMHFLIAFVLLVVQFAFIGHPDGDRWEIGSVSPGSAAQAAGLEVGDELVRFDGRQIEDYDGFRALIAGEEPGTVDVVIRRDGEERTIPITLSQRTRVIGTIGEDLDLVDNGSEVVVGSMPSNGQVDGAGLTQGDQVVAINGTAIAGSADIAGAIAAGTADDAGTFRVTTVSSSGARTDHTVDLGKAIDTTPPASFLGVGKQSVLVTDSLPVAVGSSFTEFGKYIGTTIAGTAKVLWPPNIVDFLASTATGSEPKDTVDTPTPAAQSGTSSSAERPVSILGIVLFGSELTAESWSNIIGLLIGLNIMLGVLNLIPLLPFDGGHVAIAVYEKAQEMRRRQTRRYLSDVTNMVRVAYPVIMVLGLLFVAAAYLDITKGVSI